MSESISGYDAMRAAATDIDRFATAEANRSNLPGRLHGPADAYRHIIGMAELTRRFGAVPGNAIGDFNERRNWAAEWSARLRSRDVPSAWSRAGRDMDRHNNEVGMMIGIRARTVEAAARIEIERAAQSGADRPGRAMWMPPGRWEHSPPATEWHWPPGDQWTPVEGSDRLNAYAGRTARSIYFREFPDRAGGGPVLVSPHMRAGHPVSGHTRSAPAR